MKRREIKELKKLMGVYKNCIDAVKRTYNWRVNSDDGYKELTLLSQMNIIRKSKKDEKTTRKDWYMINTIKTKGFNEANKHFIRNVERKMAKVSALMSN